MENFTLDQAGQVELLNCTIMKSNGASIEVIDQVDFINIYEDIYAPFISGYIVFSDTYDLPGVIGRSGKDMIRLNIRTPSIQEHHYINRVFYIHKMTDRTEFRDRLQGYKLHFTSSEYSIDLMKTTSRAYKGTPSDIVAAILETELKTDVPFFYEKSTNIVKYTSNFWSPTKNFAYLSEHATNQNNSASYLFYENRDGFNFRSLESIFNDSEFMNTFSANDFVADVNTDDKALKFITANRNPEKSYKSILELKIDKTYDFLNDYKSGVIKSKLYCHDLTSKKLDIKTYSLTENTMEAKNIYNLYSEETVNNTEPVLMKLNKHFDVSDNGDTSNHNWLQKRAVEMGLFLSAKVQIGVFGRTDYTVGKRVALELNRMMQLIQTDDISTYLDRVYSGEYITTAVVHKISRSEHRCTLELSKSHTNSI